MALINYTDGNVLPADDLDSNFTALDPVQTRAIHSAWLSQHAPNTVISGLELTPSGTPDLNVTVSAGYYVGSDGLTKYYSGGTATFITAALGTTTHRCDLLTITDAGAFTITSGSAVQYGSDSVPTAPTGETMIGYATRYESDNTLAVQNFADCRIIQGAGEDKIFEYNTVDGAYVSQYGLFQPIFMNNSPVEYIGFRFEMVGWASGSYEFSTVIRCNSNMNTAYHDSTRWYEGTDSGGDTCIVADDSDNNYFSLDAGFSSGNEGMIEGKILNTTYENDDNYSRQMLSYTCVGRQSMIGSGWTYDSSSPDFNHATLRFGHVYSPHAIIRVWGIK